MAGYRSAILALMASLRASKAVWASLLAAWVALHLTTRDAGGTCRLEIKLLTADPGLDGID